MTMHESEYVVMDSRAIFDTDAAAILEACGPKRPSWKSLRKDWGGQEAVLVRWFGFDGKAYTQEEVVGVIK